MHALLPGVGFTPTEPSGWDGENYYFLKQMSRAGQPGMSVGESGKHG